MKKLFFILFLLFCVNSFGQINYFEETEKHQSFKDYYNSGLVKAEEGDHVGAIEDFNQAIKINPDDIQVYIKKGASKTELNDIEGAKSDFAVAHLKIGKAYYSKGNHKLAIESYTKALEYTPNNWEAFSARALSNSRIGNYKESLSDYDYAIFHNVIAVEANPQLGGSNDFAEEFLIKQENLYDLCKNYHNRAITKSDLNDYLGAIKDLNTSIEINLQLIRKNKGNKQQRLISLLNRALFKHKLEDYVGAVTDFTEVIKLSPENVNLGYYYKKRGLSKLFGKVDGVCEDIKKAIGLGEEIEWLSENLKDLCKL